MKINSLFPTPVGFFDLGREFTSKEKSILLNKDRKTNIGNFRSLDSYVLKDNNLADIKNFIETSTNEYFKEVYRSSNSIKVKITQSWLNYTDPGGSHHAHSHQNSIISGVLYIQTNSDDKIEFIKETNRLMDIVPLEYTEYNSDIWWFNVKPKDLLLFPSGLGHRVPNTSLTNSLSRISLSFNTWLSGTIGNDANLTELVL